MDREKRKEDQQQKYSNVRWIGKEGERRERETKIRDNVRWRRGEGGGGDLKRKGVDGHWTWREVKERPRAEIMSGADGGRGGEI